MGSWIGETGHLGQKRQGDNAMHLCYAVIHNHKKVHSLAVALQCSVALEEVVYGAFSESCIHEACVLFIVHGF